MLPPSTPTLPQPSRGFLVAGDNRTECPGRRRHQLLRLAATRQATDRPPCNPGIGARSKRQCGARGNPAGQVVVARAPC